MRSVEKLYSRLKSVPLVGGTILLILTMAFAFNYYSGLTYAVEVKANESRITVDQAELFNITNLYPGQPPVEAKQPLRIKNVGESEIQCTISSKLTDDDQRLFNILKLRINDSKGQPVYNGDLKHLNGRILGTITPGASKLYKFSLELPADVDSTYESLSTAFQFEVAALTE